MPLRRAIVTVYPDAASDDFSGDAVGTCTGVVVESGWAVTAAHCTGVTRTRVRFWDDVGVRPAVFYEVDATQVWSHPNLDVALLEVAVPGLLASWIEPIALWAMPIPERWTGMQVELAGRGLTEEGQLHQLRFVAARVSAVYDNAVEVNGEGESGACVGDSGGPLLIRSEDEKPVVAGVLTGGSVSCVGRDIYTRSDRIAEWAAKVIDNASFSSKGEGRTLCSTR